MNALERELVAFAQRLAATPSLPGEERDLCVGDLATRASIPRTTTVRWVRQLDRHGCVTLFDDKKDKRAVRVQLTPAGERAVEATFISGGLKIR